MRFRFTFLPIIITIFFISNIPAAAKIVTKAQTNIREYVEDFNSGEGLWAAKNLDGLKSEVADGTLIVRLLKNSTYFVPNSKDASLGLSAEYAKNYNLSAKLNCNKFIDPSSNKVVPEIKDNFKYEEGFNAYGIYWGYRDDRNYYLALIKGFHFAFGKVVNGAWTGLGWQPLYTYKGLDRTKKSYEDFKKTINEDQKKDLMSFDKYTSSFADENYNNTWDLYLSLSEDSRYTDNFNYYQKSHNLKELLDGQSKNYYEKISEEFIPRPVGDDNVVTVIQDNGLLKILVNNVEVFSSSDEKYMTELGDYGVIIQQAGVLQVDKFSAKILGEVYSADQEDKSSAGNYEEGLKAAKAGEYAMAHDLWLIEAEKGDAKSQYNLGLLYLTEKYRTQQGLVRDLEESRKWFWKASEQGFAEAQYNLGYMYATGTGVDVDFKKAEKLIRASALNNLGDAQLMLGGMYYEGKGVPHDKKEAYAWWVLAADNGVMNAVLAMDKAKKEWDPKVIEEGGWRAVSLQEEITPFSMADPDEKEKVKVKEYQD